MLWVKVKLAGPCGNVCAWHGSLAEPVLLGLWWLEILGSEFDI